MFDEGDRVRVVAWARQNGTTSAIRVSQEYVVQAVSDKGSAVLAGPPAFAGMSGGAAIDLATGKVVGITVQAFLPEKAGDGSLSRGVTGILVAALASVPADRMSKR
jgi:hypothetical protein